MSNFATKWCQSLEGIFSTCNLHVQFGIFVLVILFAFVGPRRHEGVTSVVVIGESNSNWRLH